MKKYSPLLVVLAAGFLSLTLTSSYVMAAKCEHMHQLSKVLNSQTVTTDECRLCVCEKEETYVIKQTIQASILSDCDCDETNDLQCGKFHQHPNSGDGDFEGHACVWDPEHDPSIPLPDENGTYQSPGIRNDCIFETEITRWIKYCKDNTDFPGEAAPRAGYHKGKWWIWCTGDRRNWIARGSLKGCDGVDPSFERPYTIIYADMAGLPNPQRQPNEIHIISDFCDGADCYWPGMQVGCIMGRTNDRFFRDHCPPVGTYTVTEVGNISECPLGNDFVINDFRGKQICITPDQSWKVRACYSGWNHINPFVSPCQQFGHPWSVRLEGIIAIKGCGG